MSRRFERQYVNQGLAATRGDLTSAAGIYLDEGTTVPADATAGYAPGALFINRGGAAGYQLYVNEGSNTSSAFKPISSGARLVAITSNTTLTQALHAGKTMVLTPGTNLSLTLPAAAGTGDVFAFVISSNVTSPPSGNITITRAGSDIILGNSLLGQSATNQNVTLFNANGSSVMSMNSGTRGGLRGDKVFLQDIGTGNWLVRAELTTTGSPVTPFS